MININRRIQIMRNKNPEVMQGVVQPIVENGELYWRPVNAPPGQKFPDITQAVAYVKAHGLNIAQESSEYIDIRVPAEVRRFDDYLKSIGGKVDRYQYELADDYQLTQFEKVYHRDGKYYGWLVPDDKTNTYVRAFGPGGEELTYAEIADLMKRKFGIVTEDPFHARLSKRQKMPLTRKQFEMHRDDLRIGLIDLADELDLDEYRTSLQKFYARNVKAIPEIMGQINVGLEKAGKAKISTVDELIAFKMREAVGKSAGDGFSLMRVEIFEEMYEATLELQQKVKADAQRATRSGHTEVAQKLLRDVETLQSDLDRLRHSIDTGAAFNIRYSGTLVAADDSLIVDEVLQRYQDKATEFKGNVIPDKSGFVAGRNVDVLTYAENITGQFGYTRSVMDDPSDFKVLITMEPLKHSYETILDLQTMASNPEVFTRQLIGDMTESRLKEIRGAIDSAAKGEGVPPAFRATLESMAEGNLEKTSSPELMRRARNLLKIIDSGQPIGDNAYVMSELIDLMEKASFKNKGNFDMPKLVIPGAQRGELVPRVWAKMAGIDTSNVGPNQPMWDARSGTWIMHEVQGVLRHASLGGFDWDDAMIGMYRYDQESRTVRMLGVRQPNARYEQLSATLAHADELVMKAVGRAQKEDVYNSALKQIKALQKVNMKINRERMAFAQNEPIPEEKLTPSQRAHRTRPTPKVYEATLKEYDKKVRVNQREIHRLQGLVDEILTESLGSYKEISRASGGIIGDPIPIQMADPVTGKTVAGIAYEGEDGKILMSYAKPPADPALFEASVKQQMQDLGVDAFRDLDPDLEGHIAIQNRILQQQYANIDPQARNAIGIWSNPRMVLDTWWGSNQSLLQQNPLLEKEFRSRANIILMEQETVIDVMRDMDVLRASTNDMIALMYEMTARYQDAGIGIKIDPALLEIKGRASSAGREAGLEAAQKITGKVIAAADLLMDPEDDRAIFSRVVEAAGQYRELFDDYRGDLSWGKFITEDDSLRSASTTRDAIRMLEAYDLSGLSDIDDPIEFQHRFSQASQNMLDFLTTTFEDGKAGERTHRTVLRALQMSGTKNAHKIAALHSVGEQGGLVTSAMNWLYNQQIVNETNVPDLKNVDDILARIAEIEDALRDPDLTDLLGPDVPANIREGAPAQRPALLRQLQEYRDMLDPRRPVETIRISDVEDVFGSLTSGRVEGLLEQVIDSDVAREMLHDINRGMSNAVTGGSMQVPVSVQAELLNLPEEVSRVVPGRGEMPGVFSPELVIRRRSGGEETLGNLLYQFDRSDDTGVRGTIAHDISEALLGFRDILFDQADADDLPSTLRNRVIRAMERMPTDAPGAQKLDSAREAARLAATVAETKPLKQGGFFRAIAGSSGGKALMALTGGLATLGIVRSVIRKDRTINEMQGPAFMPGGNPYQDDPYAHGSQNVNGYPLEPPRINASGSRGGVTYQVRTRGGNYDSDFVDQIGNITGGRVTGTTYDAELPFRSQEARQRILESYS
jgi:hypothetical protein